MHNEISSYENNSKYVKYKKIHTNEWSKPQQF